MTSSAASPASAARRIRQAHRWLGIVFTLTIVVTTIALAQAEPVIWMSYIPLLPLALLLLTGLYLVAQHSLGRRRRALEQS